MQGFFCNRFCFLLLENTLNISIGYFYVIGKGISTFFASKSIVYQNRAKSALSPVCTATL